MWHRMADVAGAFVLLACVAGAAERRVTIETTKGDVIEGIFRGATETDVSLEVAGQALHIPFDSVRYLSFSGRLAAATTGAASADAHLKPGSLEDALAALEELHTITKVGMLREQYSEKLVDLLPRVNAFLENGGDDWHDVRSALEMVVFWYQLPLKTTEMYGGNPWRSAPEMWQNARHQVLYVDELHGEAAERTHVETPTEDAPMTLGEEAKGRLGRGDSTLADTIDKEHAGQWVDRYQLELASRARMTLIVGARPVSPTIFLHDSAGKRLAREEGPGRPTRIEKELPPGRYTVRLVSRLPVRYRIERTVTP